MQESALFNLVGGGAIQIDFDSVGAVMTVSVTTPNDLDLICVWIEATTNKPATFTQLY